MNVIITGSTGMVGKSVLLECIDDDRINEILVINRTTIGIQNKKLKEVLLPDFSKIASIKNELRGYDAIFHCMGISAVGLSEEKYTKITYDITKEIANLLFEINPEIQFNYVSGSGTDSTEKGRVMWTRVKGKTENYILNKGFKDAYMIRLGAILPEKGIQSKTKWYNIIYKIIKPFFPWLKKNKNIITTTNFGKAMIATLYYPQLSKHLNNKNLNALIPLS